MGKFKFIIVLFIMLAFFSKAQALDIQYGSIIGYSESNVLVEYYGIDKKNNYICNVSNLKCTTTKKTTLGATKTISNKDPIIKELEAKGATHITTTKSNTWLAYLIPASEEKPTRTYVVKNIQNNIDYTLSENVPYWDIVNEQQSVFQFSPDEKTLIYLDDKDNDMSLYKVELNSLSGTNFESTKIATGTYNISYFIFSDSENIYYVGNNKEDPYNWSLYHLDLKTGKEKIIENNVSYVDSILNIGSSLIFKSLQAKGYGPEIYDTKTEKLSYFKIPNIKTSKSIQSEKPIKIGDLNAVMMMPPSYNKNKTYPLLIWLHGGPIRQTSLGYHPWHSYGIYDAILKLLQKNNVIVLKLDYRGSFGYGLDYSGAIKGNVGKSDTEDVMSAVSYAKNQYHINNVYLAGNSYGGYMSLRTVVEHPDTFKGIFSINGVTDWESLIVQMKTSIFNSDFNGIPNTENRNLYDQASILSRISNLGNQKIEILQGKADRTIPLWQATLLYNKLKEAKKNVSLVTYKGEDHVYKNKKNIGDMCIRLFGLIGIKADKECNK